MAEIKIKIPAFVGIFKQKISNNLYLIFSPLYSTVLFLAQPGLSVESVWLR